VPQVDVKPKTADARIPSLAKPSINPPTTAKMIAAMEKRRSYLEEKRRLEEEKIKEEQSRKDKLKRVAHIAFNI